MTDKSVVLLDVGGTFVKGGLADSTGELADGLTWQVPILSEIGTECLLLGGQISRSYIFMEKVLKEGLEGVAPINRISPVAHIEEAALYGAFATFARQYPDIQ